MTTKDPFQINLADLDGMRSKIPEVEAKVEDCRGRVREAQRDFAYWQAILDRLRMVTGTPAKTRSPRKGSGKPTPAIEAVANVINESAIPLRATDVEARMADPPIRKTIRWALWKAHSEQRIGKVEEGLYASLDYIENHNGDQPRLDDA